MQVETRPFRFAGLGLLFAVLLICGTSVAQDEAPPEAPAKPAVSTDADASTDDRTLQDRFNEIISEVNTYIETVMFFDISFGAFKSPKLDEAGQPEKDEDDKVVLKGPGLPFTVVFLAAGAVFFTFWYGWINIRGFFHAIAVVRGKYTKEDDPGDVTPFRALTSALSATVGLGNIAGVAIAVKMGGPGAIFWMMFLGFFGMTAKFHESTLAQMFRRQNPDGTVSGGPMYYLDQGLKSIHPVLGVLGKLLAIVFAIFCMAGALGGGNMFQANQAYEGFHAAFVADKPLGEQVMKDMDLDQLRPLLTDEQLTDARKDDAQSLDQVRAGLGEPQVRAILTPVQIEATLPAAQVEADQAKRATTKYRVSLGFGLLLAVIVGMVVIGGITRIGAATSKIVPTMCLLYVCGCLVVILGNLDQLPGHVALIFTEAFQWDSAYGGLIGVMIMGFKRAAFSSEAGLGSSAIAPSAAKASHPAREGFVASLEPFIDTIIICFMTAMVVLITDAYIAPELANETNGTAVTMYAFEQTSVGGWFPTVLSISVVLFAFSTMISWCYYGERAFGYLFSLRFVVIFRLLFVFCVFIGSVTSLDPILGFSDLMILSMAFPNILGGIFLVGMVKKSLKGYLAELKTQGS